MDWVKQEQKSSLCSSKKKSCPLRSLRCSQAQCQIYSGHSLSRSPIGPVKKLKIAENSRFVPSIRRWVNLILYLVLTLVSLKGNKREKIY